MNLCYYLDEVILVSYVVGVMFDGLCVVVVIYLEVCGYCCQQLVFVECIGGFLFSQCQLVEEGSCQVQLCVQMFVWFDVMLFILLCLGGEDDVFVQIDIDLLLWLLCLYFGLFWCVLCWCWIVFGVYMICVVWFIGDNFILLKIVFGKSMLVYSYGGFELIQIFKGVYDDVLGYFGLGDMVDLDGEVEYQLVILLGVLCICVVVLDVLLCFLGWFVCKVQLLVGLQIVGFSFIGRWIFCK